MYPRVSVVEPCSRGAGNAAVVFPQKVPMITCSTMPRPPPTKPYPKSETLNPKPNSTLNPKPYIHPKPYSITLRPQAMHQSTEVPKPLTTKKVLPWLLGLGFFGGSIFGILFDEGVLRMIWVP